MRYIRLNLVSIILCPLMFSCMNNDFNRVGSVNLSTQQKDTNLSSTFEVKQILKTCTIDENYFNRKTIMSKELTKRFVDSLNLTMIESINADVNSRIKILDTILQSNENLIIVVSQESENENLAYLVNLNANGLAFQFEPIYYSDIVEYISSTSTIIKDNLIKINTETYTVDKKPQNEIVTLHYVNGKIVK